MPWLTTALHQLQDWRSGSALLNSPSDQILTAAQALLLDSSGDEHINSKKAATAESHDSDHNAVPHRPPGYPHHSNATHEEARASGDDAGSTGSITERSAHMQPQGGTLIIAPLTVVQNVWARELAYKVPQACAPTTNTQYAVWLPLDDAGNLKKLPCCVCKCAMKSILAICRFHFVKLCSI